ncbi:MAG TPA: hypothetical protein PL001_03310 [Candidatus Kryptobacter bacterium]|nr:MAG: hypothetical protein B7Z63_01510 [Ignavibacteriae bacterium 37-53-5]HQT91036.1 hypothetical protein [Candidatus Kryptobacter bacterium]
MKTKYVLVTAVLAFVFTLTVLGQTTHKTKTKPVIKKNNISRVMGKPTYESTVDSLNMEVWVMTQAQHKRMMNGKMGLMMRREMESLHKHPMMGGMSDSSMGMDFASRKAMMEGTHFIMLDVTNTSTGKEIADASAKVQIVDPSKNAVSVNLKTMMSHFASGLTLKQRGQYLLTVNLNIGAGYKTMQFKYVVR